MATDAVVIDTPEQAQALRDLQRLSADDLGRLARAADMLVSGELVPADVMAMGSEELARFVRALEPSAPRA